MSSWYACRCAAACYRGYPTALNPLQSLQILTLSVKPLAGSLPVSILLPTTCNMRHRNSWPPPSTCKLLANQEHLLGSCLLCITAPS